MSHSFSFLLLFYFFFYLLLFNPPLPNNNLGITKKLNELSEDLMEGIQISGPNQSRVKTEFHNQVSPGTMMRQRSQGDLKETSSTHQQGLLWLCGQSQRPLSLNDWADQAS